mmetsp:Transcript_111789/g.312496  ORF Transcript_111789/g.312496 Transcript_111789/m.312496 type:complete len:242 (+) Transcript_111789:610-1335(+)
MRLVICENYGLQVRSLQHIQEHRLTRKRWRLPLRRRKSCQKVILLLPKAIALARIDEEVRTESDLGVTSEEGVVGMNGVEGRRLPTVESAVQVARRVAVTRHRHHRHQAAAPLRLAATVEIRRRPNDLTPHRMVPKSFEKMFHLLPDLCMITSGRRPKLSRKQCRENQTRAAKMKVLCPCLNPTPPVATSIQAVLPTERRCFQARVRLLHSMSSKICVSRDVVKLDIREMILITLKPVDTS